VRQRLFVPDALIVRLDDKICRSFLNQRFFICAARFVSAYYAPERIGQEMNWSRLSEQKFRVDKWSLCRG
jgi:hypothetical protein